MKNFKFEGWIHSKGMGDDKPFGVTIQGKTRKGAEEYLKNWLKKRSSVDNDFRLVMKSKKQKEILK